MRRLKKFYPFDVKKRYKCMYLRAVFLQFCLPAYEIEFEYRCNHKKCIVLKSKSVSFKMHSRKIFPLPRIFEFFRRVYWVIRISQLSIF